MSERRERDKDDWAQCTCPGIGCQTTSVDPDCPRHGKKAALPASGVTNALRAAQNSSDRKLRDAAETILTKLGCVQGPEKKGEPFPDDVKWVMEVIRLAALATASGAAGQGAYEHGFIAGLRAGWRCGISEDNERYKQVYNAHMASLLAETRAAPASEPATRAVPSDALREVLIKARRFIRGRHSTIPYGPQRLLDEIDHALATAPSNPALAVPKTLEAGNPNESEA